MRGLVLWWLALASLGWGSAAGVTAFTKSVTANGRTFTVKGVRVDLTAPTVSMKLGLAYGCVGRTESLAGLAKRYTAVAAINGSFFDAYSKHPLKNPDMSLITGGRLVFKSNIGSMLGFEADNTPHLACPRHTLRGTVTDARDRPQAWYAYWLNRQPQAATCSTLFTRQWGPRVAPMGGTCIVMRDGKVTAMTTDGAEIPDGGSVLHIRGDAGLLRRFTVGATVTFTPELAFLGAGDAEAWGRVQEGVGCGPRVLVGGQPVFAPADEGFTDPKVLTRAGARSAAGFTAERVLFLITTSGRVADLGHILQALGCVEGMNLDGGASSGLWYRGAYLTTPGRQIGNALLVLEQKP